MEQNKQQELSNLYSRAMVNVISAAGQLVNFKQSRNPFLPGADEEEKTHMDFLTLAYNSFIEINELVKVNGSLEEEIV